ncbi:hypothetical protein KJ656_03070 [bacterium]|nr:hypothetical protein [bacterium]
MKKGFIFILITVTLLMSTFLQAEEKGGVVPCLASCLIGPRVGLEMNEGIKINTSEYIALGGSVIGPAVSGNIGTLISMGTKGYMAYDMGNKNGFEGILASFCLGPRIGNELDYRKIRTIEWLRLVPCVCIYPAIAIPLQAYNGKTMTEIEVEEGLRK